MMEATSQAGVGMPEIVTPAIAGSQNKKARRVPTRSRRDDEEVE
jgi:hypothetical protein